jgi:hypothetical protein
VRILAPALPGIACLLAVPACSNAPEFPGVPPDVVEDCRREVVMLTEGEPGIPEEPLATQTEEQGEDVIEDARAARAQAQARDLSRWPEEVLLYRCLAARGVELGPEQARELAEWEGRLDGTR